MRILSSTQLKPRTLFSFSGSFTGGLILFSALVGCAQTVEKEDLLEDFSTKIFEDSTKQFRLVLTLTDGARVRKSNRPPSNSAVDREIKRQKQATKQLIHYLDDLFVTNQYCREGYLVLEKKLGASSAMIRGECNDLATEVDREAFPNTHNRKRVTIDDISHSGF